MIFAVSPNQTFEYILEEDRKSDEPTVFTLRTLTARELCKIEDKVTRLSQNPDNKDEVTISLYSGTQSLEAILAGLRGWKNFKNVNGEDVPFKADKKGVPKEETLDLLPSDARSELSGVILARSRVTEEDGKK